MHCQPAAKIIELCGGAKTVSELAGVDLSRVTRWRLPREQGGTGGTIPSKHQARLLTAARARGIKLEPAHFFPSKSGDAA